MRLVRTVSIAWLSPANLPIAGKLGLSAIAAMALLVALTAGVLDGNARTEAIRERAQDALETERGIKQALATAAEVTIASGELRFELTREQVGASAQRAETAAAAAVAQLDLWLNGEDDDTARQTLIQARAALTDYVGLVKTLAGMRGGLIALRDDDFFPLESQLGIVANRLIGSFEQAEADPAAREMALRHVAYVMAALTRVRSATQRYLATGDGATEAEAGQGAAAADTRLAALAGLPPPPEVKVNLAELATLAAAVEQGSHQLYRGVRALDALADGELARSRAELDQTMAAALAVYANRAAELRQEAAAAASASASRILMVAGAVAALLALTSALTGRAIAPPIRAMERVVARMAAGETEMEIGYGGRSDEIGGMAAALEQLRGVVRDAFLRSQMIDQLPIGIMTAEGSGEFRITYLNPETERVLARVADHLPVAVDALLGRSVDIFHAHPQHQRALLADPANLPHRARIRLGEEVLELNVTAIRDRDGQYVGPMLTWAMMTRQVELVRHFEQSVGAIAGIVSSSADTMQQTAGAMTEAARDAGLRTLAVATASDHATANVQSVAAATEQLAASVQEIGRQVAESARIAGQAVHEAEATDRSVAGLAEAAQRIGDVVRLIGDIAARTNLLALNATIEAARAGEAGRGFAVVAGEVKNLAAQTARATDEIAGQIAAMQGATGQAMTALRSIGATIQRMDEIATAIAGAVEEQGAATQEIARNVLQAATGTAEVSSNIGEVTQAVDRTGAQAGQVFDAAKQMTSQSETLRAEVAFFLQAVQRAA